MNRNIAKEFVASFAIMAAGSAAQAQDSAPSCEKLVPAMFHRYIVGLYHTDTEIAEEGYSKLTNAHYESEKFVLRGIMTNRVGKPTAPPINSSLGLEGEKIVLRIWINPKDLSVSKDLPIKEKTPKDIKDNQLSGIIIDTDAKTVTGIGIAALAKELFDATYVVGYSEDHSGKIFSFPQAQIYLEAMRNAVAGAPGCTPFKLAND